MIRFIGKRILQMIPVVLLVATLIFGILYLVPGDPAQIMLGSTASEYELAEMREQHCKPECRNRNAEKCNDHADSVSPAILVNRCRYAKRDSDTKR